jgi:DNA replication ATP-dependent helicase Dna2
VKRFAQLANIHYKSFEEVRTAFNKPKVVATTCLGINQYVLHPTWSLVCADFGSKSPIFSERQFDYCIVDEASQITLPVCLGPIRLADAFILVGDHYQLPPLVKTPEAREGGLDISLFKLLSEAQPQAVVNLEHQYRMCEEIMTLSNELIYSGRLKCGTPDVAKRALKLPDPTGLEKLHRDNGNCNPRCWLADLFCENIKACFVDTDCLPAREEKQGDRTINRHEAELVFQVTSAEIRGFDLVTDGAKIVEGFLSCGIDPTSIGVITVYRSQLKIIQHLLSHREKVEMHTADKFQGRDKEIIVISLVRSNDQGNVGDLLRDWRRINVAFTRARSKLIILGSKSTLISNDLLKEFVGLMERNAWVYSLPAEAHLNHRSSEFSPRGDSPISRSARGNGRSPKRIHGKANGIDFLGKRPVSRNIFAEEYHE